MAELDLSKQVGPLPLGGWVIAVAGGVGLFMLSRRGSSADQGLTGDEVLEGYRYTGGDPGVGLGSSAFSDYPAPAADLPQNVITDNDEWGRKAVVYLIGKGYNPIEVDYAVRLYLANEPLDPRYGTMINDAIRELGPTPYGLPPSSQAPVLPTPYQPGTPNTVPGPTPVGTTKPGPPAAPKKKVDYGVYLVKPGNTLSGIAKRHGTTTTKLFEANRKGKKRLDGTAGILTNPDVIRSGQKLIIPK